MTDASGSTQLCYDRFGNLVRKVQATTGMTPTRTVRYGYDLAGRVISMTYPSGATVVYTRDATGRITAVNGKPTSVAASVTIVSDIDYLPFGPINVITFGNGRTLTKSYDQNYGIDSVIDSEIDGLSIDLTLDDVGQVVGIDERLVTTDVASRLVGYDELGRLTSMEGSEESLAAAQSAGSMAMRGAVAWDPELAAEAEVFADSESMAALTSGTGETFEYDATGNRTDRNGTAYSYATGSHHLASIGTATRDYDAAGHGTRIGTGKVFVYDDAGRMVQYVNSGVLSRTYAYNGRGERVAKHVPASPSSDIYFVYDEAGHLIGEYSQSGGRNKEYVWVDDTLVAVYNSGSGLTLQYVLTDHLNTPRAIVQPDTNAIVWRWDLSASAFGDHAANSDPDGDGTAYTFRLRYPGQYFDSETGLQYNYFRDYDPATGRYLQADPIGLSGGISTYSYVVARPLMRIDAAGLSDLIYQEDPSGYAAAVVSPRGVIVVAAHCNPFFCVDADGNELTPSQMAQDIRGLPRWKKGMKVRLDGCNAGVDPDDESEPYAERLAFELFAEVSAPNDFVFQNSSGTPLVARPVNEDITWRNYRPGADFGGPNQQKPGGYNVFQPPKP